MLLAGCRGSVILLLMAAGLCAMPCPAPADDHYVSPKGADTPPYTNYSGAARMIQNAVNAASDGDVVWIDNSTNYLAGRVTVAKGIELRSMAGRDVTVLDGSNAVQCLYVNHASALVRDLTIRNGYLAGASDYGAGINLQNGTISNCVVCDNRSNGGAGGIICFSGSGLVVDCLISNNVAASIGGGGLWSTGPYVVTNCTFAKNESQGSGNGGGGAYVATGVRLVSSVMAGNAAGFGGGVYCAGGVVTNCVIERNIATNGGGVFLTEGSMCFCTLSSNTASDWAGGALVIGNAEAYQCTIVSNYAGYGAGGIRCSPGYLTDSRVLMNSSGWAGGMHISGGRVKRTLIALNRSTWDIGGVALEGAGDIADCTIVSNSAAVWGGGVYVNGMGGTVSNTAICWNTAYLAGGACLGGNSLFKNCSINSNVAYAIGGAAIPTNGFISGCTLSWNRGTNDSGGLYIDAGGVISNSVINNNWSGYGGGVRIYKAGKIFNCLVVSNSSTASGGGVTLEYGGQVVGSTLSGNASGASGGGLLFVSGGTSVNNIVYFNTPDNWATSGVGRVCTATCTTPNPGGTGNVTNNPKFIDAAAGNFRLQVSSPCLDTGTNSWATPFDLDGRPRPLDGNGDGPAVVDMGAFEYDRVTDSDSDGQTDYQEYMAGTDPYNSSQRLEIAGCAQISNGIVVSWQGVSGRLYTLTGSTNLMTAWTNVVPFTNVPGVGSLMSVTNAIDRTNQYYRVGLRLP